MILNARNNGKFVPELRGSFELILTNLEKRLGSDLVGMSSGNPGNEG